MVTARLAMEASKKSHLLDVLKHLDLQTVELDEIVALLEKRADHFRFGGALKYPPSIYCRLRAGSDVFSTKREISYNQSAPDWGRCNRPGEPMFYCGNSPLHLPIEVDAKAGQALTLGYWRSNQKGLFSVFGLSQRSRERLGTVLQPAKGDEIPPVPQESALIQELHDYLEDAFTARVQPDQTYKYKLTAALATFLTPPQIVQESDPNIQGVIGMQFPSVKADGNLHNYAIRATFVDTAMELFRAEAYHVKAVHGMIYQVEPLASGEPQPDGTIEWFDFEPIFSVQTSLAEVRIEHGNPDFRIYGPDGVPSVGF